MIVQYRTTQSKNRALRWVQNGRRLWLTHAEYNNEYYKARFGMYHGAGRICVVFHAGQESHPDHRLEGLGINIGGMADTLPLHDGLLWSILQSILFRALHQNEQATELQTNTVRIPKPEHKCAGTGFCALLPLKNSPTTKKKPSQSFWDSSLAFQSEENQAESNYIPCYVVLVYVAYVPIHAEGLLQLSKLLSHCNRTLAMWTNIHTSMLSLSITVGTRLSKQLCAITISTLFG